MEVVGFVVFFELVVDYVDCLGVGVEIDDVDDEEVYGGCYCMYVVCDL